MSLSLESLPTALLQHLAPFLSLADVLSHLRCCARLFAAPTTLPVRTVMRHRCITLRHHCQISQYILPKCVVPPALRSHVRSLIYDAAGPNPMLFSELVEVDGLTVAKPMRLASTYSGVEQLQLENVNVTNHELAFDTIFLPQRPVGDVNSELPPAWQLRTLCLIGPHAHVSDRSAQLERWPGEQRLLHQTFLHRLLPLHSSTLRVLEIRLSGSGTTLQRIAQQRDDELVMSGMVRAIAQAQLSGLERLRLEYEQECEFDEETQRNLCIDLSLQGGSKPSPANTASISDEDDPIAFYNFSSFSSAKSNLMRRLWQSLPSLTFLQLAWFHPLLLLPFHSSLPHLRTLHFAGLLTFDSLGPLARFSSLQHLMLDFFVEEEELRREWKGEPRFDQVEEIGGIKSIEEEEAEMRAAAAAASLAVPSTHAAPVPVADPDANSSSDVDVSFYVFSALARLTELRTIQLQSTLQERNCCRVDFNNFTLLCPLTHLFRIQFSCFIPPPSPSSADELPASFKSALILPDAAVDDRSRMNLQLYPNLVDPISQLVYLGSKHANTPSLRASLGFTHVVQISGMPASTQPTVQEDGTPLHAPGRHLYIQLNDHEDASLQPHLTTFLAFMNALSPHLGHRVLVHCDAGVSRSASFVIAFLMHSQQMTFADALAHVQRCRPSVSPNRGFLKQLRRLERNSSTHATRSVNLSFELDRLCDTLPQLQDVIVNIERREDSEEADEEDEDEEEESKDEDSSAHNVADQAVASAAQPPPGPIAPIRRAPLVLAPYSLATHRARRLKKLGVWDGHATAGTGSGDDDGGASQCILTNLSPFLASFPRLHSLSFIFCQIATMMPLQLLSESLVSLCLYFSSTPSSLVAASDLDPLAEACDPNISALASLRNLHWLILHGNGVESTCLSFSQLLQLGGVIDRMPRLRNCRLEHQPAMDARVWANWTRRSSPLRFTNLHSLSFKDCSQLGVDGVLAVLGDVTRPEESLIDSSLLLPSLVDLNLINTVSDLSIPDSSARLLAALDLLRRSESTTAHHLQVHHSFGPRS